MHNFIYTNRHLQEAFKSIDRNNLMYYVRKNLPKLEPTDYKKPTSKTAPYYYTQNGIVAMLKLIAEDLNISADYSVLEHNMSEPSANTDANNTELEEQFASRLAECEKYYERLLEQKIADMQKLIDEKDKSLKIVQAELEKARADKKEALERSEEEHNKLLAAKEAHIVDLKTTSNTVLPLILSDKIKFSDTADQLNQKLLSIQTQLNDNTGFLSNKKCIDNIKGILNEPIVQKLPTKEEISADMSTYIQK